MKEQIKIDTHAGICRPVDLIQISCLDPLHLERPERMLQYTCQWVGSFILIPDSWYSSNLMIKAICGTPGLALGCSLTVCPFSMMLSARCHLQHCMCHQPLLRAQQIYYSYTWTVGELTSSTYMYSTLTSHQASISEPQAST